MSETREKKPKKVGFFGGSFNPPHLGHLLASVYALALYELDELWWVPVYRHAFNKELIDYEHRLEMCTQSLAKLGASFSVCTIERDLGSNGRSLEVLRALSRKYPDCRFALIIGSDALEHTDQWYQFDALEKEFDVHVVDRSNYSANTMAIPNISSTRIRNALNQGLPTNDWLTPEVERYIKARKLYAS